MYEQIGCIIDLEWKFLHSMYRRRRKTTGGRGWEIWIINHRVGSWAKVKASWSWLLLCMEWGNWDVYLFTLHNMSFHVRSLSLSFGSFENVKFLWLSPTRFSMWYFFSIPVDFNRPIWIHSDIFDGAYDDVVLLFLLSFIWLQNSSQIVESWMNEIRSAFDLIASARTTTCRFYDFSLCSLHCANNFSI